DGGNDTDIQCDPRSGTSLVTIATGTGKTKTSTDDGTPDGTPSRAFRGVPTARNWLLDFDAAYGIEGENRLPVEDRVLERDRLRVGIDQDADHTAGARVHANRVADGGMGRLLALGE